MPRTGDIDRYRRHAGIELAVLLHPALLLDEEPFDSPGLLPLAVQTREAKWPGTARVNDENCLARRPDGPRW